MSRRTERWRASARVFASRFFARAKEVVTTDPDRREADAGEVAAARELAANARRLKGAVAKVAQMAGYFHGRDAAVDPDARAALTSLWDDLPPMDPEDARRVITEDLGRPPEELYAEFDERPFASASIGQVHAATGHDGAAYAVKVQYPEVAEAVREDLSSARLSRQLAGTSAGTALAEEAVEAIRVAVLAELDYRAEAAAQERFAAAFAGDEEIVIPLVVDQLSSGRVLTMGRIDGSNLATLDPAADPARCAKIAATIFRYGWSGPLLHGLVNADPNPGNYVVMAGDQVGFLDYGCTATLDDEVRRRDLSLWRALLHHDPFEAAEKFRFALFEQGMIHDAGALSTNLYREWERLLAAPFANNGGFRWSSDYAAELTETTSLLCRGDSLHLPAGVVLLWRQRLGITAVLGSLEAGGDFRAELRRAIE